MRSTIAIGILACFLLSIIPAISQTESVVEAYDEIIINDKMIDDSELTLPQLDALNSIGMGRGANTCILYTSPSPRDRQKSRMPSSA